MPPGPRRLPLIGSLHHLVGKYPLHRLRELAKIHGPLMHVQLGEVSAVIASSPSMAKAVFKTHDLAFASRPKLLVPETLFYKRSDIFFCSYGDYWRQVRKIVIVHLLSNKNVKDFGSIRQDEVSRVMELVRSHVGRRRPVNVRKIISRFTSSMTCRAAFGSILKNEDEFITLVDEVVVFLGEFDVADIFPSLKFLHRLSSTRRKLPKIHKRVDAILDDVIDCHKKKKKKLHAAGGGSDDEENLIDYLLRINGADDLHFPITDDNIKALTSAMTLVWAMVEMLRSPNVLAKAQAEVRGATGGIREKFDVEELRYMKLVVKETLRLHPALPLSFPRECIEETKVEGYTIPAKTWIMVKLQSISRDPAYWEDAGSFEPERFESSGVDFMGNNFEFLPFGGGRRICPGLSFGLANVYLPLAHLLYHFDWKLPRQAEHARSLDLTELPGIAAGKKDDLYLVPTPYTYTP
ncbi:hypothetical protein DM860_007724 [Cuscuta australis]|uniref:Cytochrome P450 n=1 Tax=Cuscuta australis TaxID=267555 RepID=A0A328E684_9ASTE|nr:hypothetical protein DM860_007724 [Cuscuta australis]